MGGGGGGLEAKKPFACRQRNKDEAHKGSIEEGRFEYGGLILAKRRLANNEKDSHLSIAKNS